MLGIIERNHAVRRRQMEIYELDFPKDDVKTAMLMTCQQRNRLRGVRGSSPSMIALGYVPTLPGGASDEPYELNTQVLGPSKFFDDQQRRVAAAKAFISANNARAVRAALLARNRPPPRTPDIGERAYYWRVDQSSKLEKCHWKGPALVTMVEFRQEHDGTARPRVFWLTHGSALLRVPPEQIRQAHPAERSERNVGARDMKLPLTQRLHDRIKKARGPVIYVDLTSKHRPDL